MLRSLRQLDMMRGEMNVAEFEDLKSSLVAGMGLDGGSSGVPQRAVRRPGKRTEVNLALQRARLTAERTEAQCSVEALHSQRAKLAAESARQRKAVARAACEAARLLDDAEEQQRCEAQRRVEVKAAMADKLARRGASAAAQLRAAEERGARAEREAADAGAALREVRRERARGVDEAARGRAAAEADAHAVATKLEAMEKAHLKASKRRRRGSIFNNAKIKGSLAKMAAMEAEGERLRQDAEASTRRSAAALAQLSGGARGQIGRLEARAVVAAGQEKGRRSRAMVALALREAALKTRELAVVEKTSDAESFMERTKGRSVGEVLLDQRLRLAEMEAELRAAHSAIEGGGVLGEGVSPRTSDLVVQLDRRLLIAAASKATRLNIELRSTTRVLRSPPRATDLGVDLGAGLGHRSAMSCGLRPSAAARTPPRCDARAGATRTPSTSEGVAALRNGGALTTLSPTSLRRGGYGLLQALQASGVAPGGAAARRGEFDWALHEDELLCGPGNARLAARARHGSPW